MPKKQGGLTRSRFAKAADAAVTEFTSSLPFDRRLYRHDIAGSMAHARMLGKQGIITVNEADEIVRGLAAIRDEIEQGKFAYRIELEDIHMAVESRLIELIGDAGRKLHTARSRNDQVALDMRLFAREAITEAIVKIRKLQKAILAQAKSNLKTVMPGYTHVQVAQPVLLAHHFLAYFEMLQRDVSRFQDCFKRTDVMPLGSGALAGVTYPIDREAVAAELNFSRITRNSMDAVADRDFVIDFEAAASVCLMHLSRFAEELVLWSSAEFNFIEIDDAYATGSSIMPQKKNPDVAELARGKTGRVYGHLLGMLTTMKGLPLAYNRDLQEDKEGFFDTVDALLLTLDVFAGMVQTVTVKPENMAAAVKRGHILATDLADYLVRKGESFRKSHEAIGKLVSYAIEQGKAFEELKLDEYRKFSPRFGEDVSQITVAASLAARDVQGGTAPKQVKQALTHAQSILDGAVDDV